MGETVAFAVPVQADPGASTFAVADVQFSWRSKSIVVGMAQVDSGGAFVSGGKRMELTYSGDSALVLLRTLNKADLSVKSLHRRIMERLQADGLVGAGVVAGTPD